MLGVGISLLTQSAALASQTLVFALMGQSNMVGRASYDGGSLHPPGVLQWGRAGADDGQLVPATSPLQHHDPNSGQMGLDISFAEAALAARPTATIILIPLADGGTGFSDNRWNPGDDLYADAVARCNAAMAALPGAVFAGFLWHQGEKDVGFSGYQAALDTMIASLRADVTAAGPTTPFILGQLVPGWVSGNAGREATQAILTDTPLRVARTGVVMTESLTAAGNDIHFAAPDLRALGGRYWDRWVAVRSGQVPLAPPQPVGTIPDQTDILPGGLAPPQAIGTIPDQSDALPGGLTPPQSIGTIPDQQDIAA
ncbi:MAG: sialate O-acetylesterase [Pseudomonadota bacterium]